LTNNKLTVIQYCGSVKTHDIDHLQNAIDNKRSIEGNQYEKLTGCPSAYGIDHYVGLCETIDVGKDYEKQNEQCLQYWTNALES
jgi:hypothetical protein